MERKYEEYIKAEECKNSVSLTTLNKVFSLLQEREEITKKLQNEENHIIYKWIQDINENIKKLLNL